MVQWHWGLHVLPCRVHTVASTLSRTVAMHNIIKGKVYFERFNHVKLTVLSAIHEMPIAMSDSTPGAMPYSTLG